ncbi:MAG: hypothetical protein L6R36_001652 [Xanthoria steineri]|nr:MAG: hypothetical protein L6R36_001652 [Xanthoria steineri]
MPPSPVVLILGAGPNIGQHVAQAFAAKGYKVALTSRSAKKQSSEDEVNISCDLSDPKSVVNVFDKVKELLGLPSVVVYNAGAATSNDPKDPFSLPYADFAMDLNINTSSVFVAAQQAVLAFKQLPDSASKTFIYTGNKLNNAITIAPMLNLGVGKSATAHMIQSAAAAYAERGFKFYYADERKADGSPAYSSIDGEAHGKHYLQLAEGKEQEPWQQTFVKGMGYKKFPTV